jgi:hypothetical protein
MVAFVLGLFAGLLACMEIGRRIGAARYSTRGEESKDGVSAVEGSVFALLGLLIAFTFSGAATRFEARRQWIVEEANAIGTAYLRLDLLPADARDKLRGAFRRYLDARIELYRNAPDGVASTPELERSVAIQDEIWSGAVAACKDAGASATALLLLPAVNEMNDLATTRMFSRSVHEPLEIFAAIAVLSFACALLAGRGMSDQPKRQWFHMLCFAGMVALTMYVILDLEYPRAGLIRVDASDRVLEDVRSAMK